MSIKAKSTEAPKSNKGASKKNKKSWRKNTSIEDIEEFLDDQRLEERLGGSFDKRKDEDLFMLDSKSQKEAEKEAKTTATNKRKARAEKPLKCYQHLDISSGVADPIKTRNRRRTLEERKNPIVVKKELELKNKGIVKAKVLIQRKHRNDEKLKKAATILERTTRRRTEFDFDLWDAPADKVVTRVKSNEWLESQTKTHTLKNTGKMQRNLPADLNQKMSKLPAVEVPHAGASYNPSFKDHQDLLWKAAVVELNKEKEQHRIDYHTTRMFPDKKDAPDHNTWLSEMSEGVEVLGKRGGTSVPAEDEEDKDGAESSDDSDDDVGDEIKPKTKKQRRKEKERRMEEKRKIFAKTDMMRNSEVFRLKSIRREIKENEQVTAERMVRKAKAKEAKLYKPAMLSGYKFEAPDLELKLTNELTGNLRTIKPEGSLLEDRYKSLQKRNVIETRVKQKIVRNNKKRKRMEKRSYKMGFSWEK